MLFHIWFDSCTKGGGTSHPHMVAKGSYLQIDFKLHMAIKQLSNTTHTKKEEARSNPTGTMNIFQIQTKKHYFLPTTKLHLVCSFLAPLSKKLQKGLLISIILLDLAQELQ